MADDEGVKSNGFNEKKVKSFITQWDKAEAKASSEIGVIMARVKGEKADILEAAENIGIKKRVMRNVIQEHKLRTKADGLRDEFAEKVEDQDLVDQRDNVAMAAGLPLFDSAEEGKVVPIKGG